MGLFNYITPELDAILSEKRSGGHSLRDPALARMFGGPNSASGVHVDETVAMSIPTFYACVKVLSEDIGKLPLCLYRKENDGRYKITDGALNTLISRRPNRWQTPFEFKQQLAVAKLIRGNGYAEIITDRKTGQIGELVPLNPQRVMPFRAPDGSRAYAYQPPNGPRRIILQGEMLHLMGMSDDGMVGRSVLDDAAQTLGLAYSVVEYGAKFFANGAAPGGVLMHPNAIGPEAMENIKKEWTDLFTGFRNAHKLAVLEEGMRYEKIQLSAEDAQFIESRKLSPVDICQFFRMPPHKVGILDKATFSNIEQQSIEYYTDALLSHLVNFEETANRDLLKTEKEQASLYFRFNPDIILRADIKTRYEAYRIATGQPWQTPNETRAKEEMNPLDGLDDVAKPLNMDNPGGNPADSGKSEGK